ncbi:MAG TPA: proline--tRNA ligase [Thermoleophilaceae bacterium]|nr:proline--tRNA ligase [Thermoleophilaceae bacterium]
MALPSQTDDFPAWYQEVVRGSGLAEPAISRGAMVIKPYGFALWEAIQRALDDRIKATGAENVYFPLLIPYHLLEREAQHVEGFAPEVAVVSHAGGKELEEPYAVRPTSETIIWATVGNWIQSWRDLPLLLNQWCNVVRWELRPRLFLRTTEFLWQEGHTAHETREQAWEETTMILRDVYQETAERDLLLPVITGRKSPSERFAGAVETLAMEALMRDGRALQAGTSHYLGQNFSRAYDVRYTGRDGAEEFPHTTSWGTTTRLVGALIMAHGDDSGLRLPPGIAPHQVVIVPIYRTDEEREQVLAAASRVDEELRGEGLRVKVDDRDQHRPGYKFNEWELKGVPVRVELGPRDIAAGQATVYRRDLATKDPVPLEGIGRSARELLDDVQRGLFEDARRFRDEHTFTPDGWDEMRELLSAARGFVVSGWCEDEACEARVKEETKATIRCLPLERERVDGDCPVCGRPATERAYWAQAY